MLIKKIYVLLIIGNKLLSLSPNNIRSISTNNSTADLKHGLSSIVLYHILIPALKEPISFLRLMQELYEHGHV